MVFDPRSNRPLRLLLAGALAINGCRHLPTDPAPAPSPPAYRPAEAWPRGFDQPYPDAPAAPASEAVPGEVLPVGSPTYLPPGETLPDVAPPAPVEEQPPVSQALSESARLTELNRPLQGELVIQPPWPESGVQTGSVLPGPLSNGQGERLQGGIPPVPSGVAVASRLDVQVPAEQGRQLVAGNPLPEGLRDGIEVFLITPQDQGELLAKPNRSEQLIQGAQLQQGGRKQLELPLADRLQAEQAEALAESARLEQGQDAGQGQRLVASTLPVAPQVQQGSTLAWSPLPAHRPEGSNRIPLANLLPARWEGEQVLALSSPGQGLVFAATGQGFIVQGSNILTFTPEGQTTVWSRLREPAGHLILADGTHLLCDTREQAVLWLDARGKLKTRLAEEYQGASLRRPASIISDGGSGFYFTDSGFPDIKNPIGKLFHLTSRGELTLLRDKLDKPVGLTLSADGKALLVAESGSGRLLELAVETPTRLGELKVLVRLNELLPGSGAVRPAEIATDSRGLLYVACPERELILILDRLGQPLRQIATAPLQPRSLRLNREETCLYATGGLTAQTSGAVYCWKLQDATP